MQTDERVIWQPCRKMWLSCCCWKKKTKTKKNCKHTKNVQEDVTSVTEVSNPPEIVKYWKILFLFSDRCLLTQHTRQCKPVHNVWWVVIYIFICTVHMQDPIMTSPLPHHHPRSPSHMASITVEWRSEGWWGGRVCAQLNHVSLDPNLQYGKKTRTGSAFLTLKKTVLGEK